MKSRKEIKVAKDFIYTLLANCILNGVLQLLIYPVMTSRLGESYAGDVLYFMGIIYIFPQAVGTSLSNVRQVIRKNHDTSNGDYSGLLVLMSVVSALICGGIAYNNTKNAAFMIGYMIFAVIYGIRMYAQVEYRLNKNFAGYFFYYLLISVGYVIGFFVFLKTGHWLIIFTFGELAAVAYAAVKLHILRPEKKINKFSVIAKETGLLMLSILIRDGVNQFDKVILKGILGSEAVTEYSAVSMIAKVVQMFVNPVNTLIIAYLTVKGSKLSLKTYKKYIFFGLGAGAVLYVLSLIGTPIYLKLFYNQMYDKVIMYSPLVNLGLIMSFIASLYMAVLLSQEKTGWYTVIQMIWGGGYFVLGFLLTNSLSIWGIAITMIIVNGVKLVVAVVYNYKVLKRQEELPAQTEE